MTNPHHNSKPTNPPDYDHLLAQAMLLRESLQELMPLRYAVKNRLGKTETVGDIVRRACNKFDGR